jgi:hypothetical protein
VFPTRTMDEDMWNQILQRQLGKVKPKWATELSQCLQFTQFQTTLTELRTKYASSNVNSFSV